jgi:hypothetical protein
MKARFARYKCPRCGGGVSRTHLYPRSDLYEFQFPSYSVPTLRICVAIAVVGLGLAFVHIALSVLGVLAIASWVWWRYYGALQCDDCRTYYISGQFAGEKRQEVPWNAANTKTTVRYMAIFLLIGLVVFTPIYLIERQFNAGCAADCASQGLAANGAFRGLRCTCVKPK